MSSQVNQRHTLAPESGLLPGHLQSPKEDGYHTPDPGQPVPHNAQHFTLGPSATDWFQHLRHHVSHIDQGEKTEGDFCELPPNWPENLNWKERVKHVTWAYFTICMATGGIANAISTVPFRFHGLETIGDIFFLLNLVFYVTIWSAICFRFYFFPYTFKASFTHPTESLFVPAALVSFGTILITIVEYGFGKVGPWLNQAVVVLFWLECAVAVLVSVAIYLILWSTQYFTVENMTPIWIFPAYPMLIIGPHAANLASRLEDPHQILTVIVGGFTIQGMGYLVSLTMYSAFVYRLMTRKLPAVALRPGMFVSVGPSAFTVSGTIGMAANIKKAIPTNYMGNGALTAQILLVAGNWMSLWLWGTALWFFFVSLGAHFSAVRKHRMHFAMSWNSFIFPQSALVTATFGIGKAFDIHAIQVIGCVMICLLISMWFVVMFAMARAIRNHHILWPQKGEDKDEGKFKVAEMKDKVERSGSVSFKIRRVLTSPLRSNTTGTGTGTGTATVTATATATTTGSSTEKDNASSAV